MIDIKDKKECCGCFSCKNVCPRNAISMVEDKYGFKYPKINHNFCINCGLCDSVCPILNQIKDDDKLPKSYACMNKEEKIRMKSTSGGLFTIFASYVIKKGGVVFGAKFNEKFDVEHVKIEKVDELEYLRSSKYIQSNVNKTFKEAKQILEKGQLVLFTGTPCQIEGLKTFLKKDYENLITQDLICHGVPSKKVWEKYLLYLKENGQDIEKFYFRNKDNKGWNKYQILIKYKNNEKKYIDHSEDFYMKIFLSDIALRDACYDCKFKKKHRISDITLADFWGIEEVMPEMNDEKGTSLLFVNTKKAEKLLDEIKEMIIIKEVKFEDAIKHNRSMISSPKFRENRNEFFNDLENLEFEILTEKYK